VARFRPQSFAPRPGDRCVATLCREGGPLRCLAIAEGGDPRPGGNRGLPVAYANTFLAAPSGRSRNRSATFSNDSTFRREVPCGFNIEVSHLSRERVCKAGRKLNSFATDRSYFAKTSSAQHNVVTKATEYLNPAIEQRVGMRVRWIWHPFALAPPHLRPNQN
jgi:hypothetical protein